jgi:hypothetical protein
VLPFSLVVAPSPRCLSGPVSSSRKLRKLQNLRLNNNISCPFILPSQISGHRHQAIGIICSAPRQKAKTPNHSLLHPEHYSVSKPYESKRVFVAPVITSVALGEVALSPQPSFDLNIGDSTSLVHISSSEYSKLSITISIPRPFISSVLKNALTSHIWFRYAAKNNFSLPAT